LKSKNGFNELSGRHGNKYKRHKKEKTVSSPTETKVQASEEIAATKPENGQSEPTQEREVTPLNIGAFRKPDPFDLALWGLVITAVIASIYYFQLLSMQDSVELSRKSMQIDQRAWLTLEMADDGIVADPSSVKMCLKNIGKTPAKTIDIDVVVEIVRTGNAPRFDYTLPHQQMRIGVLFPNQTVPITAQLAEKDWIQAGSRKFAQGRPMNDIERTQLSSKTAYAVTYGTTVYWDMFGDKQTLWSCVLAGTGDPRITLGSDACTDYNKVKSEKAN
jgi:hypothetical protein